jgi:hypothetical protein
MFDKHGIGRRERGTSSEVLVNPLFKSHVSASAVSCVTKASHGKLLKQTIRARQQK